MKFSFSKRCRCVKILAGEHRYKLLCGSKTRATPAKRVQEEAPPATPQSEQPPKKAAKPKKEPKSKAKAKAAP